MAFRIHDYVVRGEIDNTRQGIVTGEIWLAGQLKPMKLELDGNCWRDLAGCRCTFVNPQPVEGADCELAEEQIGEVGDMTASRKVRIPELPIREWCERRESGLEAPEHWGNALYLEWFSERNGRVVVESADYQVNVSLPEWEMTDDEERRQHELNAEAITRFMNRLEAALKPDNPVDVPEDRSMDEYEWENFLQQCDARSERYGELLDKFQDHPDCERIVAEYMGWEGLADMLKSQNADEVDDDSIAEPDWSDSEAALDQPEPDPAREGIDWVRTGNGDIKHPLQERCFELSIKVSRDAKKLGLIGSDQEKPDTAIADMCFDIQRVAAKLAGALGGIARGQPPIFSGFIVAYLKRALKLVNQALGAIQQVEDEGKMDDLTSSYRTEMFDIRAEIIALMNQLRK